MLTHQMIYDRIAAYAPYENAETWDPTGKTVGNFTDETTGVLLSLDLTFKALKMAIQSQSNLIITHHPFLFSPVQALLSDNKEQQLLLALVKHNISCFSCHTNLDVAENGVAVSFLKTALGSLADVNQMEILLPLAQNPKVGHCRSIFLKEAIKLSELQKKIDDNLKTVCQINTDEDKFIENVAFAPGAFDESWIPLLENKDIDLLITGEIKHHVSVMLHERDIALLAAGHGASEQTVIPHLANYLRKEFPKINFVENGGIIYNNLRSEQTGRSRLYDENL